MKKGLFTLALLSLAHFLVDFQIGIYAVYKTMVGLNLAIAGVIYMGASLIGEGSQALFGPLSDSGYRKTVLLIGIFLAAAGSVMGYHESSLWVFLCLLSTFIGSGAFHPSAAGLVSSLSHRKGLYFSLFAASGAVGLSVSQISFYNVYSYLDGHTAVLALPLIALGVLCVFLPLQDKSQEEKKKVHFSATLQLFRRADLRILYCVLVCNQMLFWGTIFILPDILVQMGCDDWISYGGGHMALILGGAAMMIPGGILADIYSPKTVMLAAIGLSIAGLYTFVLLDTTSPLIILSVLAVMGSAFGALVPMGLTAGHQLLPGNPSLVSAFVMGMVWCVAEGLAPMSGILATLYSGVNPAAQALATMGVVNIVGLFATFRLPSLATSGTTSAS